MKLSSKKHGKINAFYYKNSAVFHTYTLGGLTIAAHLNWMFTHISKRSDLKKSDLKLVADTDGDVRMINTKNGSRLFFQKIGKSYAWFEETVPQIETMHEDYEYNQ
jgi:hypothetical protein